MRRRNPTEEYPFVDKFGKYRIVELCAPRKTEYGTLYTLQVKYKKMELDN